MHTVLMQAYRSMNRRTMLMRPALAWAAVIIAVVAGNALGEQHHWDRPRQLLHPPYVDKVPFTLLAAFILLALTGLFVAALLQRRLVPTRPAGSRGWLLAAVAVAGTVAATWAALYTTSIEDAAIPVLDWPSSLFPSGSPLSLPAVPTVTTRPPAAR